MMSGWPEGAAESACRSADVPKGLRAVCSLTRPFALFAAKRTRVEGEGGAGEPDKLGEDGKMCKHEENTKTEGETGEKEENQKKGKRGTTEKSRGWQLMQRCNDREKLHKMIHFPLLSHKV